LAGWTNLGEVSLCNAGKPKFPSVMAGPGLYRISLLDGRAYIGQAEDVKHRVSEYRTPTAGVELEHWICYLIKEFGGGTLEVFIDKTFEDKALRLRAEQFEISLARERGIDLLNGPKPLDAERIRFRIQFHENEVRKLKRKLETIECQPV
jgi:hypothetical protein